jgi:integrase
LAFRWHDLRHYAVTELIAQGADIKLLQAIAGHKDATMTLNVYGHLMTELGRTARNGCSRLES